MMVVSSLRGLSKAIGVFWEVIVAEAARHCVANPFSQVTESGEV